jgi:hypothetical protein
MNVFEVLDFADHCYFFLNFEAILMNLPGSKVHWYKNFYFSLADV